MKEKEEIEALLAQPKEASDSLSKTMRRASDWIIRDAQAEIANYEARMAANQNAFVNCDSKMVN